jgi:hypothetical protein
VITTYISAELNAVTDSGCVLSVWIRELFVGAELDLLDLVVAIVAHHNVAVLAMYD